jgi:hypothetical protein
VGCLRGEGRSTRGSVAGAGACRLGRGHHGRGTPKRLPPSGRAFPEGRMARGAGACADEVRMGSRKRARVERVRATGDQIGLKRQQGKQSHGCADGQRREPAAPDAKCPTRCAGRPMQSADAILVRTVRARTAVGGQSAALPSLVSLRWFAGILSTADAARRRAAFAGRAPARGATASPSKCRPLIRASVMTKAVRTVHLAKTWTRMRCHTASASIAPARGTWKMVQRLSSACIAYCASTCRFWEPSSAMRARCNRSVSVR